jgi:D-alanyl-D-alanine carboxypeptidase/D-alanyl-D-alanine-endopeptidase (penicillin-binding protein 4)
MKNNRRFLAAPTLSLFLILSFLVSAVPAQSSIADRKSLNEKFTEVVSREILNRGTLGVKIAKLEGGEVIFEHNAEKYFMPASNMKSFTVSTALETFGPEFRFITSFYAPALPDKKGKIKGDLIVYGRGDVSISPLFHDGDLMKGIDQVTDKLIASGIKKIEGNIVADDSFFIGDAIPSSWEYDDLTSYYGAEVSSLPINDNAVDMTIKPSSSGKPCIIEIKPALTLLGVVNNCITSEPQTPRRMQFQKSVEASRVTVAGSIASDDAGFTRSVAIHRPGWAYVELLKQSLERKGIKIKGRAMVIDEKAPRFRRVEIARYESAPLWDIAAKIMKPSQNMFTETLLRGLGERAMHPLSSQTPSPMTPAAEMNSFMERIGGGRSSSTKGSAIVDAFLERIGAPKNGLVQMDGSGLSRHNLVTPSTLVHLYRYMALQSPQSNAWMNSLTIGGIDGTLRNRFKGTTAMDNARGKTGTINQVSALSGYVTSSSGEKFVFSILVNGIPDASLRVSTIDEMVMALAGYSGN